jgi:predicted Zn-dependent peptidase
MKTSDSIYSSVVLPNGLRVVYLPANLPVCYCGLAIGAGSRDEQPEQLGLAHFVEHLLFKGTAKRKPRRILNRMERVGGELNAYTTKEETFLYSAFLWPDAERAIELLADLAFYSQFPENEIGKEREVICDEIRSYEDNPAEAIFDEFENIIFSDSELGHSILGNESCLRGLTSDACRAFAGAFYHPENMVFFFHGKATWKKIVRLAERYFGGVPHAPYFIAPRRIPSVETAPTVKKCVRDLHQTHVALGGRGYGLFDDKRLGLLLLNNILGGPGMNSRLNISLREERGLVYAVDSTAASYTDTGVFCIYFACDSDSTAACLRLIDRELKRLRERRLTDLQLYAAVKQLKGELGVSSDQRESVALRLGKNFLHYGRHSCLREVFDRLDALSADYLLGIANEVLDERRLSRLIFE